MFDNDPLVEMYANDAEPVHRYFGLSYASWFVMPRVLMQSMPTEWQQRFVRCLAEFDRAFEHVDWRPPSFQITARDYSGRFIPLPDLPSYDRGRAHVEPRGTE